ncbi:sensor histidine kinase [Streptomyces meridianus]|uniref:Sensor histidine kinase n=1 Tax=Streptomyces meridianus TaxID=2938945 RepID=A0ABT0XBZ2_9ACTN|nr:sensor histidine kinase [Streptomyces meridianus]MCM2580031.1 sensor histidine kinase [Streptomyces meridianus]
MFSHPALLYRGEQEFLERVGTFVRGAVAVGEPVLVAVPAPRLHALRDHLDAVDGSVTWADMSDLGRNPGRILSALQSFADAHPGRHVHIVGEPVWAGRTPAEMREATRHEALINLAFAGRTATILCPYDTSALPAYVVHDAHRTHPVLVEGRAPWASSRYADPLQVCGDCDTPLTVPPLSAHVLAYAEGELAGVRAYADQWASGLGLPPARRTDLTLAIGEAVSNSVRHGGGRGTLRLWTISATMFAETTDSGGIGDPLTGRRRPDPVSADGGRGVWMMHQLCDLVEIRTLPGSLVVRLSMDLD